MRSRRVILAATLLGVLAAAAPIAAAGYLSWLSVMREEKAKLARVSDLVLARTEAAIARASEILKAINATTDIACSPEHIAEMRRMTVDGWSIEEIGYFRSGRLACTSWGLTAIDIAQTKPDFTTADGIAVTASVAPAITNGHHMMAMQLGSYNVLLSPARMIDVILDPGLQIAVAHEGGFLVSSLNQPDRALTDSLFQISGGGDDDHLFAVSQRSGWMVAAIESRDVISSHIWKELLLLLPIGAMMGATLLGVVVWFSRKRLSPTGELALAVRNREFVVHYQPIVELKSGRCVGAEALVRWQRPDGSLVRPDLFIPLAEETGLILPITDQVIETVVSELKTTLSGDRDLHIAINFAAADMKSGRMIEVLEKSLHCTDIQPSQIWLEATERGLMDVALARETMTRARALGHAIAIDDFGTGYSSLQYLQDLPIDALKIDKSFIDTIGKDSATSSVTPHIIEMAKALNLAIVAEGVETQVQADYLIERGVGFAQGWLFSKPLSALAFVAFHLQHKNGADKPRHLLKVVA